MILCAIIRSGDSPIARSPRAVPAGGASEAPSRRLNGLDAQIIKRWLLEEKR